MSGATEAYAALLKSIGEIYARTTQSGQHLAGAAKRLRAADDIALAYAATAHVILALESLAAAAEASAKDARAVLLLSMQETGCPQVADDTLTAYPAREPAVVVVDDDTLIPSDLMTAPKPQPDRRAIKAAIELQGRSVPGASILQRNSQRIVIRTRKGS